MKDQIHEIVDICISLPNYLIPSIILCSGDVEGGYGWHRFAYVKITLVDDYCEKCGYSTIFGGDDNAHPFNNHSWKHREEVIFMAKVVTSDDIERFKDNINKIKTDIENEQRNICKD